MTRQLVILAVSVLVSSVAYADDLLDEVAAGSRANFSKIASGTAEYSVTREDLEKGDAATTARQVVSFDGQRSRIDSSNERRILTPSEEIVFDTTGLNTPEARPDYEYSAIITPRRRVADIKAHPQNVGCDQLNCIADVIEANRATVRAQRDGDLIRVDLAGEGMGATIKSWVSPQLGYNVVRQEVWVDKLPGGPAVVRECEFVQADNNAFVLSRSVETRKRLVGGSPQDSERTTVELTRASLKERPDPKMFTVAGLGLPGGAHVWDRVHGKQYTHGKLAVNERNILPERPLPPDDTWRMPRIDWLSLGVVGAVLACVAFGFLLWRSRG